MIYSGRYGVQAYGGIIGGKAKRIFSFGRSILSHLANLNILGHESNKTIMSKHPDGTNMNHTANKTVLPKQGNKTVI